MDYQTFRPVTKPSFKQKISHRKNLAEQNYNYVSKTKSPKHSNTNTQTYSYPQSKNIPQPTSNSVFFINQLRFTQDGSENYPFFQQNQTRSSRYLLEVNLFITQLIFLHQTMNSFIIKINNDSFQAKDLVLTSLINKILSNQTHEMNKYDNLEKIQHHPIIFINYKTQLTHNFTNQLKCITKSHCHIIYNNMK